MPRLRKDGSPARKPGRKSRAEQMAVDSTIELEKDKNGKFAVARGKCTQLIPVVIPDGIAPIDYLTKKQLTLIGRIERIGIEGRPEDMVRLKANQILLQKVMPDLTKSETLVTISPYERIAKAIEDAEKDGKS